MSGALALLAVMLAYCSLLFGAGDLAAQSSRVGPDGSGIISGRVVDAETLAPLEGARVFLERPGGDGMPVSGAGESNGALRFALTDSTGAYRFGGLAAAQYRMLIERIGYVTRVLQVELRPGQSVPVSVGLEVQPIRLPTVEVVGATAQPYQRTRLPDAEVIGVRSEVARMRQQAYLSVDVRELTHGEVVEAVTLGEPDLFRALQRVPGVATRDDYTATLWTRGATWDQTRVYFDGLKLYNPTHAGWLFSAVNPDALGSVLFQPGYRSARWGEGTAAVLDLRSRSGTPGERLRGTAEISAASTRIALDGQIAPGQFRWMVAARRTYVDVLTQLLETVTGDRDLFVPYDFADLIVRVDGGRQDGWSWEASSILERDHLRGDIPGVVQGNRGSWGNRVGQLTVNAPIPDFGFGPLRARFTAGQTLFGTEVAADSLAIDNRRAVQLPSLENEVRHRIFSARFQPVGADSLRWALGFQAVHDQIRYVGPYSLLGILAAVESEPVEPTSILDDLVYSVVWGERRWRLSRWLELEAGARVELGDSVYNGGRVRISPRGAVRASVTPNLLLSGAWSRTYQYTQDVSPAAGPLGPQLHLSAIWLLASSDPFYPAARADMASVGLESWIADNWLLTANGYHRQSTGLLIPNPDTGAVASAREPDAVAANSASGIEVSLRRLAGRWTGSVGYTLGTSRMTSLVQRGVNPGDTIRYNFAAPADIPHALDATGMLRVGGGLRFGGAFTFGYGVPFTRLVLPDTTRPASERAPPRLQSPYGARTKSYSSLDLMLEYSTMFRSWQVSAYGQLRNALGQKNAVTYLGSRDCGGGVAALSSLQTTGVDCQGAEPGTRIKDNFQAGLPRLPLFGVRVAF